MAHSIHYNDFVAWQIRNRKKTANQNKNTPEHSTETLNKMSKQN